MKYDQFSYFDLVPSFASTESSMSLTIRCIHLGCNFSCANDLNKGRQNVGPQLIAIVSCPNHYGVLRLETRSDG